jgi:hypothetical protein
LGPLVLGVEIGAFVQQCAHDFNVSCVKCETKSSRPETFKITVSAVVQLDAHGVYVTVPRSTLKRRPLIIVIAVHRVDAVEIMEAQRSCLVQQSFGCVSDVLLGCCEQLSLWTFLALR